MTTIKKQCLFCQTENESENTHCSHCGMALPKKHPLDKRKKISFFVKAFWAIVLFCIAMMVFLPR